jgi:hypothetical protein
VWNSEHRIILDDFVRALKHELHAPHVAKRCPTTFAVRPVEEFEAIGVWNRTQPRNGIFGVAINDRVAAATGLDVELIKASSDLSKRWVWFVHMKEFASCTACGRYLNDSLNQFVAAQDDCRDSVR